MPSGGALYLPLGALWVLSTRRGTGGINEISWTHFVTWMRLAWG